jgi:hypothetical protein
VKQILLSLLALISMELFSQIPENNSPVINLSDIVIKLDNVVLFIEGKEKLLTFRDTAYLYLNLGETIQGKTFHIVKSGLREIKIEQQYETSLSISNEGPHLDLMDWKNYTSDWVELNSINKTAFMTLSYSETDQERFPEFTEKELIDYLISIGEKGYADLITNPIYVDGSKHWWVGLSSITIRVSGFDENNNWVSRYLNFEIPMGC